MSVLLELDELGKEHADWMRHAAFDQVRQFYAGNKEVSLLTIMTEAATVADFFMDKKEEKPKAAAPVIALVTPINDNDKGGA